MDAGRNERLIDLNLLIEANYRLDWQPKSMGAGFSAGSAWPLTVSSAPLKLQSPPGSGFNLTFTNGL
jgi:hypothetical protein